MIDWTPFDEYPESTCTCACDRTYRSHSKFAINPPRIESRRPCPDCGSTNPRAARSDPEEFTIG
jgi:hypothetical protein